MGQRVARVERDGLPEMVEGFFLTLTIVLEI
jgi:hypothetical protein